MARASMGTSGLQAARFVALGSLAVLVGSFAVWDTCPKIPCEGSFGLLALMPRTGIDVGPGIITAGIGVGVLAARITAFRQRRIWLFRTESVFLGVLAVVIVVGYLIRTFLLPEFHTSGPDIGPYLVACGGFLVAVASASLPRRTTLRYRAETAPG
jgi:hypothetical protein